MRFILAERRANSTDFYDVNMVALATKTEAGGLIQGGMFSMTDAQMERQAGKRPQPTPGPSPVKFWIAKNTDAKPLVPIGIVPDKKGIGALIAVTRFDPMIEQIVNMAVGSTMQFMMQYPKQEERVVEMTAPLTQSDAQALRVCMTELSKRASALKPGK